MRMPSFAHAILLVTGLSVTTTLPGAAEKTISAEKTVSMGDLLSPEFSGLQHVRTSVRQSPDGTEEIFLERMRAKLDSRTLLLLAFNNHIAEMLLDQTRNYRTASADYVPVPTEDQNGFAALFNNPEHRVEISHSDGLWPDPETPDFAIHFRVRPDRFFRRNVLFEKMSYLDGIRRGVQVGIENGRLSLELANVLVDEQGGFRSLQLNSTERIPLKQWTHVAISVDHTDGRIALYLNRKEDSVVYARNSSGVFSFAFHPMDRSDLVIGSRFAGQIDDFVIKNTPIEVGMAEQHLPQPGFPSLSYDADSAHFEQLRGHVSSPVIRLSSTRKTGRARIDFSRELPQNTSLDFFIRTSDRPFPEDLPAHRLNWQRIDGETFIQQKLSYLQWKAVLRSDPEGKHTPVLRSVTITYQDTQSPLRPSSPAIVADLTTDDSFVLSWKKSPELTVARNGGYVIYYGMKPGEYTGRVVVSSRARAIRQPGTTGGQELLSQTERETMRKNPLPLKRQLQGNLRLRLNNSLIRDAIYNAKKHRPMPFLRAGYTYYVAIAAYSPEGGESDLSQETSVTLPLESP